MKLIHPTAKIEYIPDNILTDLEYFGRCCYKSEGRITPDSAEKFIRMIKQNGHLSVFRHKQITARLICSRAVTHQIVRHGLAHFLQESQRYCDYSGGHVTFIIPHWCDITPGVYDVSRHSINPAYQWFNQMLDCERTYKNLRNAGLKCEEAREVLPNSTKTEVVITANLEEWLNIFRQRADNHADEAMQHLMYPLQSAFRDAVPIIFD